jgi:hypothetical protein
MRPVKDMKKLVLSEMRNPICLTKRNENSRTTLIKLARTSHSPSSNLEVVIDQAAGILLAKTKAAIIIRWLKRRFFLQKYSGQVKKVFFFIRKTDHDKLLWSQIVESLTARYGNIFLEQELISAVLAGLIGRRDRPVFFPDDYQMYAHFGGYHGFLFLQADETSLIIDVQTVGAGKWRAVISKLDDFVIKHPQHAAAQGKDFQDFFILPVRVN